MKDTGTDLNGELGVEQLGGRSLNFELFKHLALLLVMVLAQVPR